VNDQSNLNNVLDIWQVSREMSPFAEAGGIKDVVAGLSEALSQCNHKVTVVLPMYRFLYRYKEGEPLLEFSLDINRDLLEIQVYKYVHSGIRILFVFASCYDKEQIYTYSRAENSGNHKFIYGTGHQDSDLMNLVLQRAALEIPIRLGEIPDIFHLHDGHSGFLPAILQNNKKYKSYYKKTRSLLTIHNAGIVYQQNIVGLEKASRLTGLSHSVLKKIHTEYGYSPILCAARFGAVNTVSEKYAAEILDGSDQNCGNLGSYFHVYRAELRGIVNGISVDKYKTPLFEHRLKPDPLSENLEWKQEYKQDFFGILENLKKENYVFGSLIPDRELPLITMQCRVTYQKGIDIFYDSLLILLNKDLPVNFLFIGEGEQVYEDRLAGLAEGKVNFCYIKKYEEELSQRLFASGDFFIIPSRWEPCGLTDFIAQLLGNIPIVHETGGLVKTKNGVNGFSYLNNDGLTLSQKIEEAILLYEKKSTLLYEIRKNAVNLINENYTWEKILIKRYIPYYRELLQN
jgi:starch synthase